MIGQLRRAKSTANKIQHENVVLVWERIKGSMDCKACTPGKRPVNAARPSVAQIPHRKVAQAM
jgi:hypothetical protein